jgi:hypothetical protein
MNHIYNIEQLNEHLASLPIGTEDSKAILEHARRLEGRLEWAHKQLRVAAEMIGRDIIAEAMYEED